MRLNLREVPSLHDRIFDVRAGYREHLDRLLEGLTTCDSLVIRSAWPYFLFSLGRLRYNPNVTTYKESPQ